MPPNSSNPLTRIFTNVVLRVTAYYVVLFAVSAVAWQYQVVREVTRGSLDALVAGGGGLFGPQAAAEVVVAPPEPSTLALTVLASMVGAVLLALPVAWIYTLTRQKRGYQQSVVQTMMILPPLVAGVVVLVKYSLALAFSLAGIVAAVRFRNTLEDSKDAVYIFLATAMGLAAAVHLPVAAVISVVFNLVIVALWWTDFGRPAHMEGTLAQRRLERTRQRLRQTGSFVAMVDDEIFQNMTPEQLELTADRAWRRRRRFSTAAPTDEEMERRDALLRVQTRDVDGSREAIESLFDEFLKKWRFGGVVHEPDGTHFVEYAVQLKKSQTSAVLMDTLLTRPQVIGVEFK